MAWLRGDPALRAAVQRMDEVLPTPDPWPEGVSVEQEDRWTLRVELVALVTGMACSALAGARPDVPALHEAEALQARFLLVADPAEAAAIAGVLEQLRG